MMVACGIDESIAKKAGSQLEIDMRAVRRRCRSCPEPETCERFLGGAAVPDNGFCPNAARFSALVRPTECRIHYDPRHRPGRRLDG
jgi:O-acetyl-ADP-ribose deacetylase (regulator of RNase III)